MATLFELACALMAGSAYRSTRGDVNKFPIPQGWSEVQGSHISMSSGFEAVSFTNGSEIVISFAGTGPGLNVDWLANSGLALGLGSEQLKQAALYYLEVKAANPGAIISFTGHSLGGGLAALMGVLFDEKAVTFDQAPFANSATALVKTDLISYLLAHGYDQSQLAILATELLAFEGKEARESNVTGYYVQGEALQYLPFSTLGTPTKLGQGSDLGFLDSVDLHSQALLTTFLLNNDFRLITYKLPALLGMAFESELFAYPVDATNTKYENFLERLVRHQAGNAPGVTGSDAMLDRFTSDLQKIAQDGGFSLTNEAVSKTLVAFAMQMYYENPQAGNPEKILRVFRLACRKCSCNALHLFR